VRLFPFENEFGFCVWRGFSTTQLQASIAVNTSRILVADDEADVLALVGSSLLHAGFDVVRAEDGEQALALARKKSPALIVLDLMMPGMTGFELCRVLKSDPATAPISIILLSARAAEVDRVVAFELGADDYITKPFSPRELILRIRAILRRKSGIPTPASQIKAGEIVVDRERHQVTVSDVPVALTAIEFKLLSTLIERKGRVQSRESLINAVWGFEQEIEVRTIDTHLRRLRDKLGPAGRRFRPSARSVTASTMQGNSLHASSENGAGAGAGGHARSQQGHRTLEPVMHSA
jgi:two-component system phosphate regulon response regulator PhoB